MTINRIVQRDEEAIIASSRARRTGVDSGQIDPALLDISPLTCEIREYRGLPLIDGTCHFSPGKEAETTAEYARYQNGQLIIHDSPVFPAAEGWEMRVIDNKFPITDERNIFTNEPYDKDFLLEHGDYSEVHAIGKDLIVIQTPYHNIRAGLLDYGKILTLEQEFTRREMEKDHVQYVTIFRNNSGFPIRVRVPDSVRLSYFQQYVKNGNENQDKKEENVNKEGSTSLPTMEYYEFQGKMSGASQTHPHERIVSMGIMPGKMLASYQKLERKMENRRNYHLYQEHVDRRELTLKEGKDFVLMVDPVPSHIGGLVIIAENVRNILELDNNTKEELAYFIQLGQTLVDVCNAGCPSNSYFRQIFDKNGYQRDYPNYRLYCRIEPRVNIHAGFELAVGIPVITAEPADIRGAMRDIMSQYNLE